MKKLAIAIYLALLAAINVAGQGTLTLEVRGIQPVLGDLYIAFYNRPSAYMNLDSAFKKEIIPVNNESMTILYHELPEGDYAIAIFHDMNGNGELDKNRLGIPTEGYGFSNNAKGFMSMPGYEKAVFHFGREDVHRIDLVY